MYSGFIIFFIIFLVNGKYKVFIIIYKNVIIERVCM